MPFEVIVTRDFDHMSEIAVEIVIKKIKQVVSQKEFVNLGLATGNSPTGLYKHLAKAANAGAFDCSNIRSFNLDEYVGLPGENAQQRALHPESYSFFMIQELWGLLRNKFKEMNVPWGTLIDQSNLISELDKNPDDWEAQGSDNGKAIVINKNARSVYLKWIRREVLDAYAKKIKKYGGIDLHIIGVGGRGHVAFHESGIPFKNNKMLLVKLDDNTVNNAVSDGHFASKDQSPQYAISMGVELVYQAKTVLLLANGSRKMDPVAESLLNQPTNLVPISYGQLFSKKGGHMIYVLDKAAGNKVLENMERIKRQGIKIKDLSNQNVYRKVEDLKFFRNPESCSME